MKIAKLLIFFVLAALLSTGASAAWEAAEEFSADGLRTALPERAEELLGDMEPSSASLDMGLAKLWSWLRGEIGAELKKVLRPVAAVIAVSLLCSLSSGLGKREGFDYISFAGCAAISAAAISDVNSVLAMGSATLAELDDFSKALLPTLASVAAASGAVGSAGVKYAASALFLDILLSAAKTLVLPLVQAFAVCVCASSAIGDGRVFAAAGFMKKLCKWALTGLSAAFTAYIGVSGIAASGADAAAAKTAKVIISTALPVVGKMVSDASESVAAGVGILRSSIGVFGMVAVLAACAAPFLQLGLRYLLFKAAAAIADAVAGERLGKLIDGIGSAYGMILSLVGCAALFMFISVLSLIRTVV